MFPHLQAITPLLKENFSDAFLLVTASTRERCPESIRWLIEDPYYRLFLPEDRLFVGDQFATLYRQVSAKTPPDQQLHLCFLDRLVFALRTEHCAQFIADIHAASDETSPLIFQRSEKAWKTHPQNYFEVENFITTIGKSLFGKTLDYAWCHLVIRTNQLQEIMPRVKNSDMSMLAEMILLLQDNIKTKEVDWLSWEDPFLLSRDSDELKGEKECNQAETQKRLAYALPMLSTLMQFSLKQEGQGLERSTPALQRR